MPEGEIKLRPEIETLSQKLETDPKSKVFAQLADAYRKSNMIDEAIEIAKKGLEIHPNYGAAHLVLGRCYLEKRIYSLAREEFERVASLDPHNFAALKLLADVHFSQGAKEEAIRRYRQVLDIDPLNSEVAERLAQLLPPPEAQEPSPRAPEPPVVAAPPEPAVSPELESLILQPVTPEAFAIPSAPIQEPSAAKVEGPIEPAKRVPPPSAAIEPKPTFEVVGGRIERKGPLSGEEVANIVDQMFVEHMIEPKTPSAVLEAPAPPSETEAPAPAPAEAEAISGSPPPEPALQPEAEALSIPAEEVPSAAPLKGEEVADIVQSLLEDKSLAAPAISPPEAPPMIEQRPAEIHPVVEVKETPVPAKAKGTGATATLAELYEQQGFYDKALELYEQVLAESPENLGLQAKVRELRKRTYWEEAAEPEAPAEAAPAEAAKPSWEASREESRKEEPAVQPAEAEEQRPEPKAEEKATPPTPVEKPGPVEAEGAPQPGTPLFHPEAGPKPEEPERKGEIKSFQEWLDSLKKPKPGI
jgi:tetratricopeptide (TPR) repeat protein